VNNLKKFLFILFFLFATFLIDVKLYRLKLYAIQIGVILFLVLLYVESFLKKKKFIYFSEADFIFVLYIGYIFLKYIFSKEKVLAHDEFSRNLLLFCCYLVGRNYGYLKKSILNYWLFFGTLVAIYGIWQNFGGRILFFEVPKISPPFATFGNQNFFVGYLILLFPVSLGLFLKKKNLFRLLQSLILIVVIFLTKSRAGIIAAVFAILIIFYLKYFKNFNLNKKIIFSSFFILLLILSFFKFKGFFLRDKSRLLIWRDTINMAVLKNPFFGVGIGEFRIHFPDYASPDLKKIYPLNKYIVNFAHNEYLEIFSEQGVIGLAFFLIILFLILRRSSDYYLTASISASLLQAFFSVAFRFSVISSFFFLLLGLSYDGENNKKVSFNIKAKIVTGILLILVSYFMIKEVVVPLRARETIIREKDFFSKEKDKSLEELENKYKISPSYKICYELGWKYAKIKKWDRAIFYFKKAIEFKPSSFGAYNNIGNIYFHLKNLPMAVKYWEISLKINPEQVDARFNLGYAYYLMGRLKESTKHLKKVLEIDPDNAKAKVVLEKMYQ